jgi:osmoprotectant transport system substrate-binding protein
MNPLRAQRLVYIAISLCAAMAALGTTGCNTRPGDTIVVGSKNFPEQALLGEILAQHLETRTHLRVERRFYLAGSYICQQALLAGRIDTYVEYTGTALSAILHEPVESDPAAVFAKVRADYQRRFGLAVAWIQQHLRNRDSRRRCAPTPS